MHQTVQIGLRAARLELARANGAEVVDRWSRDGWLATNAHSAHVNPRAIWAPDLNTDGPKELLQLSDLSDNTPDDEDLLTAGDLRHGGANGCQVRARNSSVHPLVPLTPAVVDQSASEPKESGAVAHGQKQKGRKAPQQPYKRVPSHLWATKEVPGGRRGTEEDRGALAAEELAGAEEDNAEEKTWA